MIVQRIRLAVAPKQPLSGRARLVLLSMACACVLGVLAEMALPLSEMESPHLRIFAFIGVAALLAYGLHVAATLIQWVLAGYDEQIRPVFFQLALLALILLSALFFAAAFRFEKSAPLINHEGCWYTHHDRWTGRAEIQQTECPEGAKLRYR